MSKDIKGYSEVPKYLKLAESNYLVAEELRKNKIGPDWYVTILYYSAVHYVNVFFIMRGISIPEHHRSFYKEGQKISGRSDEFFNLVKKETSKEAEHAYRYYKSLENKSWLLRYEPDALGEISYANIGSFKANLLSLKEIIINQLNSISSDMV